MLFQQTLDKLYQLKLGGIAQALQEQLDKSDCSELSFEERLGLLVDREWLVRQERCLSRRLQTATLKLPACVEDINYRHSRGLDKGMMQDLTSCRWIAAKRNVIITGATGLGKTWLACALANKACRDGYTAVYKRVPKLMDELAIARADGSYLRTLAKLQKVDLLVLDDWGLKPLAGDAQHDLLEVIDDRTQTRSTLVTSQFPIDKWYDNIGDPSVADALLDRLVNSSTNIGLKGETMRKPGKNVPAKSAD